jgi:transposase-like protein
MALTTTPERDQVLDMLGRRKGFPAPNYRRVSRKTGILLATLRSMVRRDRQRMKKDPKHPAHGIEPIKPIIKGAHTAIERAERAAQEEGTPPADLPALARVPEEDLRLTRNQRLVVEALAAGESTESAAQRGGVVASTVRRWRREPGFASALTDATQDFDGQVRQQLQQIASRGLDALEERIDDLPSSELRQTTTMALDRTGHGRASTVEHKGAVGLVLTSLETLAPHLVTMTPEQLRALVEGPPPVVDVEGRVVTESDEESEAPFIPLLPEVE